MIIECAGLPGAGKTTICKLVTVPHGVKGDVPLNAMRPSLALSRAAWNIFLLCATTRPFTLKRLMRGFNLVLFLRHYEDRGKTFLLDQGIVQKLWSMLADATRHSSARLAVVMTSLAAFAPDWVVWLETPLDTAVHRMGTRVGGKSRYDGIPDDAAAALLKKRAELLSTLTRQFGKAAGARLLVLDGAQDVAVNAARIDVLLAGGS